jgi:3-phenylpropionate/trans-cinnamate dioxygenase ferredoxin reductase subunit
MNSTIVIVGGGQAGSQAIDTLRREGFAGRLVLISDESTLPYQRPPLSKKFLSGELEADRLPLRHLAFYEGHNVELKMGIRAVRLDAQAHRISLSSDEDVAYDRLLLCLGATSRQLSCPGSALAGIHYLRTVSDVAPLRAGLVANTAVVVIGGGYIGLETAATARKMGCQVTILEMTDRLMNRVVAPDVSAFFVGEHRKHGVQVVCGTQVQRLEGATRVERVVCSDGSSLAAQLVIVGVGAVANMELASQAGLECKNGIVVDHHCRTSDEAIFAAGDCTYHPSLHYGTMLRLECVDNAFEQGKTAALNMLGKSTVYDRVPWFWSDQYDNKLQIVGLSQGSDRQIRRGEPGARSFSVCHLKAGELIAVEAVNNMKDFMAARKLIGEHTRPDIEQLADAAIPLKSLSVFNPEPASSVD